MTSDVIHAGPTLRLYGDQVILSERKNTVASAIWRTGTPAQKDPTVGALDDHLDLTLGSVRGNDHLLARPRGRPSAGQYRPIERYCWRTQVKPRRRREDVQRQTDGFELARPRPTNVRLEPGP